MTINQKIPLLFNPKAGSAGELQKLDNISSIFDLIEIDPEKIASTVAALQHQRIAVSGGDGSIATVASAIDKDRSELAIVPSGTLNHFAKDHGIPTDIAEAIEAAVHGRIRTADIAYVNNRLFLNTSSVGAYVSFVRTRERMEKTFGYRVSSIIALSRIFWRMRKVRVTLEVEGQMREYVTPLVFIGVGERDLKLPTLGGRVEDGRRGLHVMIVRGGARARLLTVALAAAAQGIEKVSRTPHVDSFIVDKCTIHMKHRNSGVSVDGEIVALESPLEYRFVRDGLNIVIPNTKSE